MTSFPYYHRLIFSYQRLIMITIIIGYTWREREAISKFYICKATQVPSTGNIGNDLDYRGESICRSLFLLSDTQNLYNYIIHIFMMIFKKTQFYFNKTFAKLSIICQKVDLNRPALHLKCYIQSTMVDVIKYLL